MLLHCSICQREFRSEESPALPFCSERCRLIDLGRWLDEKHSVAIEPQEDDGENPPMEAD
jgi:uncharacterized protein